MTVTVTDFKGSLRIEPEFDHVIGMLDHKDKHSLSEPLSKVPNRSMFWFDDSINDGFGQCPPTEEDIASIIKTIRDNGLDSPTKNVLIHCHAGIARSTAAAWCLCIMQGMSIKEAHDHIRKIRPQLWPNELILRHFDKLLGLNGELLDRDTRWKKHQIDNDRLGISMFSGGLDID